MIFFYILVAVSGLWYRRGQPCMWLNMVGGRWYKNNYKYFYVYQIMTTKYYINFCMKNRDRWWKLFQSILFNYLHFYQLFYLWVRIFSLKYVILCSINILHNVLNETCLESHPEPVTPITDSWAQGSVPIFLRPSSASSTSSIQSDHESELSSIAEERPA